MKPLRISVSDIDSWRYWKRAEDMPLEEIRRRLLRLEPPTDAMAAGTALHAILEDSDGTALEFIERDGFMFSFASDLEVKLPAVREIPATMELCGVTLSGRVDAVSGLTIWDHKLSKSFDAEKYHDSYQWRLYLQLFSAQRMIYNVFEAFAPESDPKCYQVRAVHPLTFYAYPGMEADNERIVMEFGAFWREYIEPYRFANGSA